MSEQVSEWGGDRGNGWLQCSKNIPDAAAWWRLFLLTFRSWRSASGGKPGLRQTAVKTHLQWSFGMVGRKGFDTGCGEMKKKRSKESEAWFFPLCHYPHFLATAGQLPCNEGQFRGFSPGMHTKLCSKEPYTQIPLSISLYPGLYIITTSPAFCITVGIKAASAAPDW